MMTERTPQTKKKGWIVERRSLLRTELVRQVLEAKLFFDELYQEYRSSNRLSFEKLEGWIGTEAKRGLLWNLKEKSHFLFRTNCSNSFYERLFDWTLGLIFHDGMKLKESVYLLEVYEQEGKRFTDVAEIPADVDREALLEEFRVITARAQTDMSYGMENLHYLFSRATEQLSRLLALYKQDSLLLRFLVENENLYERVYGTGSLEMLFLTLFRGNVQEAYLIAARNYREGGWYGKALAVLKKALEMNPADEALQAEIEMMEEMLIKSE
ncbi:MAG TPA: hypothetical protein PKJ77_01515 [Thermodesulfobacteriota bacterium]|nr:hypothetical protein [Thermodesulfobacteriota bacterium]HOC37939.1 hypothetical protein [Thermodesulfobacteriota bacterium]